MVIDGAVALNNQHRKQHIKAWSFLNDITDTTSGSVLSKNITSPFIIWLSSSLCLSTPATFLRFCLYGFNLHSHRLQHKIICMQSTSQEYLCLGESNLGNKAFCVINLAVNGTNSLTPSFCCNDFSKAMPEMLFFFLLNHSFKGFSLRLQHHLNRNWLKLE